MKEISDCIFPMCQVCGKVLFLDTETLHFHHVDEDKGHPDVGGGKQHLYLIEEDLSKGVEIELRCTICHELEHDGPLFREAITV
jgi:hypothetical protein